jgi:thiol-disulfide isomerase/thioredoxin
MENRPLIGIAAVVLLCSVIANADVQLGDKPQLSFKDFLTKKNVDLAGFKGKIVVVDFWATWCGPCMAEANHMVSVNAKYSDKGLQFIGISLDSDPAAVKTVMAEKKFTWLMSYQGQGWDGSIPKTWGVTSIPQTFIIGPDGDVLWRGHPAMLDEPLADAFKNHPPVLVDPAIVTAANATLDQVEKAIADNKPAKALKLLASVPDEAKLDKDFAARSKAVSDKLLDYGNGELTSIDPLIESGDYSTAITKLRDLSTAFAGTPVAASAKAKLISLGSDPKVRKALDEAKTDKEATDALAVANKLKADKKDDLAYPRFKNIVKLYPGTSAASDAAAAVKAYEADTAFITKFNTKANTGKAESMLSMAESYKAAGNLDLAKKKYQDVIAQFPNTSWAQTAAKAIEEMGN